jgi:hypothetical protein
MRELNETMALLLQAVNSYFYASIVITVTTLRISFILASVLGDVTLFLVTAGYFQHNSMYSSGKKLRFNRCQWREIQSM